MKISIVVSVYNEEVVLLTFYNSLKEELIKRQLKHEIIFVNDGSFDNSQNILEKIYSDDEQVKVLSFSRNYGHESAMLAGIDHCNCDFIICMDADLQHPPQKIYEIAKLFTEGYEVINMVRTQRADASWFGRLTSKYFYRILNKFSDFKFEPNASDFFAISNRVATIIKTEFRDRNRFLRGFIQQVGFKRSTIYFDAPERVGGESKYNFSKLLLFSISIIVANSKAPLRFSVFISFLFVLFSITLAFYSIFMKFLGNPFSGYTTIIVFLSLAFGLLFFILGVLGEYIGNLYNEIKSRPLYVIDKFLKHSISEKNS
jgi:dolichol-phosphate mannosyltransferase